MTLRRLAACGLLLAMTGVGAGCGGLRATPGERDAGADRTGTGDGAAGTDSGKDVTPTADAPADLPPVDGPVDHPPDVPAMDAPTDTPPTDVPVTEPPPACGNGQLDPGETCDPPSTCPTACPAQGCQLFSLTGAGTCQAACVAAGMKTACTNGDGCCPAGCNAVNDTDCLPRCGNGVLEAGEMCDGSCPTSCPPVGCQQRTLQGSAATCDARCVNGATTTACTPNDSCCPTGCNTTNDADCVVRCGNGVVEAGELCDGNCPTSCAAVGCQLRVPMGDPAACDVRCVDGSTQTACANGDGCCPSACNSLSDSDCQPVCGNGVVERAASETCDPPSACMAQMTACVSDADNVRTSSGSVSACTYVCTATPRACGPADGLCPTGCGPTRDVDCPGCGNGRLEPGETCDPPSSCMTQMTACVSDANNVRTSSGAVSACTYVCTTTPRACGPADGFCPTGCVPTRDVDCPGCGNGRLESGETCDVAPAAVVCSGITCNDGNSCTTDARMGADASCNVACTHTAITACTGGDGCCPGGGLGACNRNNDSDCAAVCGNGVVESGETCDVAPAAAVCSGITCNDGDSCTTDTRTGANASCNVACTHTAITACTGGDSCCPGGGFGACNHNNDGDCAAVCGNGVVEGGETCDTAVANSCPTACAQMACVLPTLVNRGTCTAACVDQGNRQTVCVDGDGCCPAPPSNCSDINDTDCATPNDTCPNARDISAGGDFPFSLMTAKEETPGQCTPDGPEVFFTFTVANPSAVYLDVFDPNGKQVDVALEVWANGCPTATTKPIACDATDGGKACGGATWPRIFFTNTDIRTYVVVARATNGVRGRYSLRLQYVPLGCVSAGAFPVAATQPLVDTTCGNADLYAPSCTAPMMGGLDKSYYLVKCPAQTLSLSTCQGRTGNTDTVLLMNRGSMRVVQGVCTAVAPPIGREIACNDERPGTCAANPNNTHTSEITSAGGGERGIFTITVDTHPIVGAANCGPFGLSWLLQ